MIIPGILSSGASGHLGLAVDYLVIAGGGGGGNDDGSGGGAGGYLTSIGGSPTTLSFATAFTVTVGAGGSSGNATPGS